MIPAVGDTSQSLLSALGTVAADFLLTRLRDGDILAISPGTTVQAVAQSLDATRPYQIEIVPMLGAIQGPIESDMNYLATRMAESLCAKSYQLHAPAFVGTREQCEMLRSMTPVKDILDIARHASIALLGVGTVDPEASRFVQYTALSAEDLKRIAEDCGGVGEISAHVYDIEGRPCAKEYAERVIGLTLEEILQIPFRIGVAATAAKARLAYNMWVWADFFVTFASMFIFVYFWRAVYEGTSILGGLSLSQTVNYILLARLLAPLLESRTIFFFGFMIRQGQIAVELTRPLDLQARIMVESFTELFVFLVQRLPLFLIAWLIFGMRLPTDPALWLAFFISLVLGQIVLFLFDWMFACLAFYVTETWGLSVVRVAAGSFFSGAIVPLVMMPAWLQKLAAVMPFAQALSVPVSFLSGITTFGDAPRIWLIQIFWLLVLLVLSRLVFNVAVRKVTVQGG